MHGVRPLKNRSSDVISQCRKYAGAQGLNNIRFHKFLLRYGVTDDTRFYISPTP